MIIKTKLPHTSILNDLEKKYDYVDSYKGTLNDTNDSIQAQDVGRAFFASSPKWIGKLFNIRNKLISIFGLKTSGKVSDRQKQLDNFKLRSVNSLVFLRYFTNQIMKWCWERTINI